MVIAFDFAIYICNSLTPPTNTVPRPRPCRSLWQRVPAASSRSLQHPWHWFQEPTSCSHPGHWDLPVLYLKNLCPLWISKGNFLLSLHLFLLWLSLFWRPELLLSTLPSLWRTSLNIWWRKICWWWILSASVCMRILISPSLLRSGFTDYRIVGSWVFFFQRFKCVVPFSSYSHGFREVGRDSYLSSSGGDVLSPLSLPFADFLSVFIFLQFEHA